MPPPHTHIAPLLPPLLAVSMENTTSLNEESSPQTTQGLRFLIMQLKCFKRLKKKPSVNQPGKERVPFKIYNIYSITKYLQRRIEKLSLKHSV